MKKKEQYGSRLNKIGTSKKHSEILKELPVDCEMTLSKYS